MKESIEDLRDMYETFLEVSGNSPTQATFLDWLKGEMDSRVSILEDKLFQQEVIIRRYESEKYELVQALNNILGESFK